jgi:peptidyl-prolyl cis-trans isomerase D
MAKNKPTRVISKKHLARLERERRQARAIVIGAIIILVTVIGMIVYGMLDKVYFQVRRPIARVNGEKILVGEFQTRARIRKLELINYYIQYYQFALMFGITNPETDPSLSDTFLELRSRMTAVNLGPETLNECIDVVLIRQYAAAHGIRVTEEDVERHIQESFNYYPAGTPTPSPTVTPLAYPTLSATELAIVTPTFTPTRAPTATPDPSATPTPLPTATATLDATATVTPTPTEYTLEGYQSNYQEAVAYYQSAIGLSEADFRRIFHEDALYRQQVYDIITADVPREQEQVWARHILVGDEATALTVRNMILQGADFAEVAAQYSLDTGTATSGGDLGWFGRGRMVAEFEEAAFSLQPGEISQPVQSQYGYHIIQVIARQNRPLTEDEYRQARDQYFETWLQEQRDQSDIYYYIDVSANSRELWDLVPQEPSLETELQKALQGLMAP